MIIGVDGYAGAGKDTVADVFVKVGFTKISFADALRESAVHSTGFSLNTFIDREIKDKLFDEPYILSSTALTKFCDYLGYSEKTQEVIDQFTGTEIESPRHLLIILGTEIGRASLNQSIWLDKYDEKRQGHKYVVTPDCRFDNERNHIKSMRGQVFWVYRDGVGPANPHISENGKWPIDQYDVTIHNTDLRTLQSELGLWWSLKGCNLR